MNETIVSGKVRYATNGLAWFAHDALVHPAIGCLGLLGRLLRSPRLMALSHHIHNASAPSNDAWGDWADAAYRASCNEGSGTGYASYEDLAVLWCISNEMDITVLLNSAKGRFILEGLCTNRMIGRTYRDRPPFAITDIGRIRLSAEVLDETELSREFSRLVTLIAGAK